MFACGCRRGRCRGGVFFCHCAIPASLMICIAPQNAGRHIYNCGNFLHGVGYLYNYFMWADQVHGIFPLKLTMSQMPSKMAMCPSKASHGQCLVMSKWQCTRWLCLRWWWWPGWVCKQLGTGRLCVRPYPILVLSSYCSIRT